MAVIPAAPDHAPLPMNDLRGALVCALCGGAVRRWLDGSHAIHAEPRPVNAPEPGYPAMPESEARALWGDR